MNETFCDGVCPKFAIMNGSLVNRTAGQNSQATLWSLTLITILFWIIAFIGVAGNSLIIYVILRSHKMRDACTNYFILSLGVADLVIMLFGIPEIVQFTLDNGWALGSVACKVNRYVLTTSLYASILTLSAVCVERFIAIIYPMKAHLVCSRSRCLSVIMITWLTAAFSALPVAIFNTLKFGSSSNGDDFGICRIVFPASIHHAYMYYRLAEFVLFFFGPISLQLILYSIIGRKLFKPKKLLHRRAFTGTIKNHKNARSVQSTRKGIVKMLIAAVTVHFFSHIPAQIPVFYNLAFPTPFRPEWTFNTLIIVLSYINSATNPLLYAILSQKYRRKFREVLTCVKKHGVGRPEHMTPSINLATNHATGRISRHASSAAERLRADDERGRIQPSVELVALETALEMTVGPPIDNNVT